MVVIRCQQNTFSEILVISFPEFFRQHIQALHCYVLNIRTDTMHEIKLPIDFTREENHILIHHIEWMSFLISCFALIA